MPNQQFISLSSYSRAILHLDCDAFFASVEQSIHPDYRGKPVITGKERGIVAAASYEAKALGIARGTKLWDVKKICPEAIIVPSDYETYSIYSKRVFAIMRKYTPLVEEYSIDEAFAEITGLSRPLRKSYPQIAQAIKDEVEASLGITVSVGLSSTKTLAKIGSKWKKPAGLTFIPGYKIHQYLQELPIENVWNIGPRTAAFCQTLGIETALQFAQKEEAFIKQYFTKPHFETWSELNGHLMYKVTTEEKTSYANISKTKTFTPPSSERNYVEAQLIKNLENAFIKARRHQLTAHGMVIFLKTNDFRMHGLELKLSRGTAYPQQVLPLLHELMDRLFRSGSLYRATGVVLTELEVDSGIQMSLFESAITISKIKEVYTAIDQMADHYGKHVLHLGSSHAANVQSQHLKERGDIPLRKLNRLPGETSRKHLYLPLLLYKKNSNPPIPNPRPPKGKFTS